MNKRVLLLCVLVAIATAVPLSQARQRSGTMWEGVYTAEQAANGEALMGQCRGCHGGLMEGGQAPALRGEKWLDYWREDTLDSMYSMIKESMPPRANGMMSESQALAIVAYILQANDVPAGSAPLTTDALPAIRIEAKSGPQPLPNYSNVQFIGCTARGEGDTWNIVRSTEPVRTRSSGRASDLELKAAAVKGLGSGTFQLQNLAMAGITGASLQENKKVLVKGVLLRQPSGDRLGINSLQELGQNCGN
jgi:S-disulfanyl-L-cysteine oxidoreductase SoxD